MTNLQIHLLYKQVGLKNDTLKFQGTCMVRGVRMIV
jgi:hypothetical protein